uniref:MIT domain-containing protein n=1 Tax=Vannella robusta TaxID=1487602 RepID=A0A7S4I1L9_9EUKA|mmetsp:Transcript_1898/g.2351  ORF Transcript_1898/g.2351 Transcript_1898/m.2351 type:complete len:326 (+) Transcript_1898:46-1023(+)
MTDSCKESFAKAILACQKAVKAEGSSKEAKLYGEAINLLNEILSDLPEQIRPQVTEKKTLYEEHLTALKGNSTPRGGISIPRGSQTAQHKIEFKEDKTLATKFMALPPPPPDAIDYRTFWLVNILLATVKRGSFLTTNIWIPKEAWYQSNTSVSNQLDKIACLEYLGELFDKIAKIRPATATASELEGIVQELATIQNHLHFLDHTIPEMQLSITHSKDKKIYAQKKNNILESIQTLKEQAEDAHTGDSSNYADALIKFLGKPSALEKLMNAFEQGNEKLFPITQKINGFVGVFLIYTLADLVYLLKEFFQKSKESFLEVPSLKD